MEKIFKELIAEKKKELIAIGIALLLIAAGAIAVYSYAHGGNPFVPEEATEARGKINRTLSRGITVMENLVGNLNSLLRLESEGNKPEVLEQVPLYKNDLGKVEEVLANMPQDIQAVADRLPEVRPRNAGKILSEAMNAAAQASIELLRLRGDMASLYAGVEARAKGEATEDYNLIVDRVNRQVSLINSLYDEFKAKVETFKSLVGENRDE